MARARKPKKLPAKIPQEVKKHVVELSLQNPDFGARRLVGLLNQEQISISSSTVYAILKRNNLQNRQRRLAKIKERVTASKSAARKPAVQITDEVAERIVQVSLQNPDFGARRLLPLLEKDGILVTAASVYTLLKRNGLQNRGRRLARIKEQQTIEALARQDHEIPPPGAVPVPASAEQPEPVSEHIEEKVLRPRVLPASSIPHKATAGKPWFLTLIDIVLLFLIVFLGFHTWKNVSHARLEPEIIAAISPDPCRRRRSHHQGQTPPPHPPNYPEHRMTLRPP